MSDLNERLNKILPRITSDEFLSGSGIGNEIAFYIFDYAPEDELKVRDYRLHQMNQWLLKRRHHSPTSSGRDSHQIIHTTCHQVITIPTTCPKAIQDTITLACHPTQ